MTKMLGRAIGAAAFALVLAASIAAAQAPDIVRVRGTIEKVDGTTLSVKGRDGNPVMVKLADDARVLAVDRKSLADVKQGVFVGITAMPQPDGTQKAVEIHIFPEALRGTGEGHRPWDLMPNSTMTNANIESAVASSDGQELVLKYKDGEKKFVVPANVEVVMFAPAAVADLKPGEKIFVVAGKKQADGTIAAPSIVVGRNGVNPPM
jgi:outer membrane lipoprotein SlyB